MQLKIVDRSGKQLADIRLTKHHPRLHDLHLAFTKHIPKYTPSRQLFTLNTSGKPVRLGDAGKPLADYGVKDGDQLIFKDLGPQIGWQTVFIIEYLGPLVLHPLLYWNWSEVFGDLPIFQSARRVSANSTVQLLILAMVIVHFAKRELETLLVHRFSHGTMPLSNLFKNCFHYWILSGVLLAWEIYSPQFAAETAGETLSSWHYSLVAVWIWAQLSNLSTHLTLCNLRPAGNILIIIITLIIFQKYFQAPKFARFHLVMDSIGHSICLAQIIFSRQWAG
jgi:very-long-chain enoyl-CoA reductase